MDDAEDPAVKFFPDGKVDLYGALEIETSATQDQVKRAYKRLALRYHPDKVLSHQSHPQPPHVDQNGARTTSSDATASQLSAQQSAAAANFQRISYAYSVLSDEARRRRYDETGRTSAGALEDVTDWDAYFRELWKGEVTANAIEEFRAKYQGSDEEVQDVLAAYESSGGDLASILNSVPCAEMDDEARLVSIVESALLEGRLGERHARWDATSRDEGARARRRERASREAGEAEEYARELGVWEELFGSRKGARADARGGAAKRRAQAREQGEGDEASVEGEEGAKGDEEDEDEDEDAEVVRAGKRKKAKADEGDGQPAAKGGKRARQGGTADSSSAASASKGKSTRKGAKGGGAKADDGGEEEGEEEELSGLAALIRAKQAARSNGMDDMLARMEAEALAAAGGGSRKRTQGKAKGARGGGGKAPKRSSSSRAAR